jgi:hypothetical protein
VLIEKQGFVVETMNTLCNIWLVNINECVISFAYMFLYVYVAYANTMRLSNPGYLQDVGGNEDAQGDMK